MRKRKVTSNLKIEDAQIILRNFEGRPGDYNPEGRRGFGVLLDDDVAKMLNADGWNVRVFKPSEDGDEPQPWLPVEVSFARIPPKIIMISSGRKMLLSEDRVRILDFEDIESAKMILRPYNWDINGKSGVKAYLKTLVITIAPDEFEEDYQHIPDADPGAFKYDDSEIDI